jgi:hypothetical protein
MDPKENLQRILSGINIRPGMIFGLIIFTALFAFEIFNYSTTEFALRDLLGELSFANMRWATILAIAFCGIDFAGIARLFTPQQGSAEVKEVWYLFGAWMLAATMNAMLTWWGVSMALVNHTIQSAAFVESGTMLKVVPIFVAVMIWVIRILIIGTISTAADHLVGGSRPAAIRSNGRRPETTPARTSRPASSAGSPSFTRSSAPAQSNRAAYNRPLPVNSGHSPSSPAVNPSPGMQVRTEPTYHSMRSSSPGSNGRQL